MLAVEYHSMQLREPPAVARLVADVRRSHKALTRTSAVRIQAAVRRRLARRYVARMRARAVCVSIDLSLNGLQLLPRAEFFYALPQLRALDLSLNHLASLDVAGPPIPGLRKLQLCTNCLTHIDGIGRCNRLVELDLSYNAIVRLSGLDALQQLEVLSVEGNQLASLDPLGRLPRLQACSAHHNSGLRSLDGVVGAGALARLDVSCCELQSLHEVAHACAALPALLHLCLHDNDLAPSEYVPALLAQLPALLSIDEMPATHRVRAHAQRLIAGRTADEIVTHAHSAVQQQLNAREAKFNREMAELEARGERLRADFSRPL
ncbi:hypothetical protein KFE25_005277 [Diacronema lutheri]|uniref:Uncharacterized protein n=1 Tax=Diacronema lutheri TaxID=2081491 RepID=A0A8J5X989_DIALT|nr:hypothetical protein KFE25_005277 [Diacronema lutheri]